MSERQKRLWEMDCEPRSAGGDFSIVQVKVWLLDDTLDKSVKVARTNPETGGDFLILFLPRSQITHNSKAKNPPEAKHWECRVSIPRWLARKNNLEEL